jgi:hypothetical protein
MVSKYFQIPRVDDLPPLNSALRREVLGYVIRGICDAARYNTLSDRYRASSGNGSALDVEMRLTLGLKGDSVVDEVQIENAAVVLRRILLRKRGGSRLDGGRDDDDRGLVARGSSAGDMALDMGMEMAPLERARELSQSLLDTSGKDILAGGDMASLSPIHSMLRQCPALRMCLPASIFQDSTANSGAVKFVEFCPTVFSRVREYFGVSEKAYRRSVAAMTKEQVSEGASGAFIHTHYTLTIHSLYTHYTLTIRSARVLVALSSFGQTTSGFSSRSSPRQRALCCATLHLRTRITFSSTSARYSQDSTAATHSRYMGTRFTLW